MTNVIKSLQYKAVADLKNSEKDLAVNDNSLCVGCANLQKVLSTPHARVNDFYYKN